MKEISSCNFCKHKSFKRLFQLKDKSFGIQGKFWLKKCTNCGLIILSPRPYQKALEKHYPKEYYSYGKIDSKSLKFKIKMAVYDSYFNPGNRKTISRMLALLFFPFARGTAIKKGKKLLDIGSGSGQFLYEMKQFGMDVHGLEPGKFDKESTEAHGLKIKKSTLSGAKYKKESFDLITINHVLEHVPDPEKMIKDSYSLLRKGGDLIVAVPNYRSLAYWIFGKNWYQLDVPRHLHDFSDKILANKLIQEGFKIKKIRHNSRPSQFTVSLLYSLNLSPKKHPIMNNTLSLIFLPLTYIVNLLKIGDQIEIYCKK